MTTTMIEARCPHGPKELLAKLKVEGGPRPTIVDNRICIQCSWCTRSARKRDSRVLRVIHEFFINGELADSSVEFR